MIVRGILGNTVGRVGSFAKRRLLGKLPENAIQGSYQVRPLAHLPSFSLSLSLPRSLPSARPSSLPSVRGFTSPPVRSLPNQLRRDTNLRSSLTTSPLTTSHLDPSLQEEKPKQEEAALLAAQLAVEDEIMEADEVIKMAVEDSFKAELEAMNYDGVESALSEALEAEAQVGDAKKELTV